MDLENHAIFFLVMSCTYKMYIPIAKSTSFLITKPKSPVQLFLPTQWPHRSSGGLTKVKVKLLALCQYSTGSHNILPGVSVPF